MMACDMRRKLVIDYVPRHWALFGGRADLAETVLEMRVSREAFAYFLGAHVSVSCFIRWEDNWRRGRSDSFVDYIFKWWLVTTGS